MKLHLAIDLGTTTLAGRLLDGEGRTLAEQSLANPQQQYGADILTRLEQARNGHADRLQRLQLDGLRTLIANLCAQAGTLPERVAAAAAAGNPVITCLLRGLPVDSLLSPPYKPPDSHLAELPPDQLDVGLKVPLQIFPLVSGFVGGDLVAVVLGIAVGWPGDSPHAGTVPTSCKKTTLVIDVGTNGELALWDGERWWVTSVAAGPAFEGGNVGVGMMLTDGAVCDVALQEDRFRLKVHGRGPARGLCGSGLAALIAAALQGGLIDHSGRIVETHEVESNLANSLVQKGAERAICFYRDAQAELVLTQTDLRNFQLAKGALHAGAEVLMERAGLSTEKLDQVLLAGALGSSLPSTVLKRVALLPEPMLSKISFVANGVLQGLESYLLTDDGPLILERLMDAMQPFPLSGTPAFEKRFLEALEF